jgi:hypothetical protein
VLVVAALAVGAGAFARHRSGVRWAREEVLPEIRRLVEGGGDNNLAAYRLALRAEPHLPGDPEFQELLRQVSAKPEILSDPSGAAVWVKPYLEREAPWERIGETPLRDVRLPLTRMRWRVEKAGFVPILRAGPPGTYDAKSGAIVPEKYSLKLVPEGAQPADMVRVDSTAEVPEFLVDRFEVTNRQFRPRRRRGLPGPEVLEARVQERRPHPPVDGSDSSLRRPDGKARAGLVGGGSLSRR